MYSFLLICPLNLESILEQEVQEKWSLYFPETPCPKLTIIKGGVEIECELEQGLSLNLILRTCQRILLRIKNQKCRDLPKLFNIIKKINWKQFLKQENIEVIATSKKSRLIHTGKIEKTVEDAFKAYFMANKIKESQKLKNAPNQKVYIRLEEDLLTISLDTSGELLYKRSGNTYRGNAPIRETYAATLLIFLFSKLKKDKEYYLIDPMCGSGTFLKEARDYYKLNNQRDFAFNNWTNTIPSLQQKDKGLPFTDLMGYEINPEVVKNLSLEEIKIICSDSLKVKKQNKDQIIIVNPPYGKKVSIEGNKQDYFQKIIDTYLTNFTPIALGIIIPASINIKRRPKHRLSFNQNGIKVNFFVF